MTRFLGIGQVSDVGLPKPVTYTFPISTGVEPSEVLVDDFSWTWDGDADVDSWTVTLSPAAPLPCPVAPAYGCNLFPGGPPARRTWFPLASPPAVEVPGPEGLFTLAPWQEEVIERVLAGERFAFVPARRGGLRVVTSEIARRAGPPVTDPNALRTLVKV